MSNMVPADEQPPQLRVVSQTMTTGQDTTGAYVQGYQVTAQLPSGTSFSVFVPDGQYNADNVRGLLIDKARHVAAVDGITT